MGVPVDGVEGVGCPFVLLSKVLLQRGTEHGKPDGFSQVANDTVGLGGDSSFCCRDVGHRNWRLGWICASRCAEPIHRDINLRIFGEGSGGIFLVLMALYPAKMDGAWKERSNVLLK